MIISKGELFLVPLISFLSTVVLSVWFSLQPFVVIPSVSTCNWVNIQAGCDARMQPSFKSTEMARVQMFGKGSKMIGDFVPHDIPVIQRYRPYILILLLGHDIGCDTSTDEITNYLIALAQQDSVMSDDASLLHTPGCATQDGGSDQEECWQVFTYVQATGIGDQLSARKVRPVY